MRQEIILSWVAIARLVPLSFPHFLSAKWKQETIKIIVFHLLVCHQLAACDGTLDSSYWISFMSCSPKSLRQSQVFQSFESLLQFPVSAHKLHPFQETLLIGSFLLMGQAGLLWATEWLVHSQPSLAAGRGRRRSWVETWNQSCCVSLFH